MKYGEEIGGKEKGGVSVDRGGVQERGGGLFLIHLQSY